jgi:hypothetical protein
MEDGTGIKQEFKKHIRKVTSSAKGPGDEG